ncbi:MAG: hypothetical protein RBS16_02225 [Candidatus Cloacimonadales bacterium]|jgi:gas vesicle protein|nr:hypothetical protein [Candidatus Cloacimonadota bacterium]MDD2650961.1 hypothetical protein [Candidatus Cloacimonadota bacterium]MDD3500838.1 hypothetical protein [Candidatus Cloacimonadota bacterium]MDX9976827.1 hypothetical protein [Candidatus Cloacimonadales bacterium]
MNKFWKNILKIGAIAGVTYVGYKGYKRVDSIMKLSKSLPDYLENVLGEKPKVSITMKLKQIDISLGISQDTFDKELEIETLIIEYIEDFYPTLADVKAQIHTYIKHDFEDTKEEHEEELEDEIEDTNDDPSDIES